MQLTYFTDGGYVIHKAGFFGNKFSVWFDDWGNVKDIEKFDKLGRSIRATESDKKFLQVTYGKRHNFKDRHESHCVHS